MATAIRITIISILVEAHHHDPLSHSFFGQIVTVVVSSGRTIHVSVRNQAGQSTVECNGFSQLPPRELIPTAPGGARGICSIARSLGLRRIRRRRWGGAHQMSELIRVNQSVTVGIRHAF